MLIVFPKFLNILVSTFDNFIYQIQSMTVKEIFRHFEEIFEEYLHL